MTTIAFDGKTLAADRQSNYHRSDVIKIFRVISGKVYGAAGRAEDALAVLEWLNNSCSQANPKVHENFRAIVADASGFVVYEEKLIRLTYEGRQFMAIGSGCDYAMAAMHLGKTAREAVEIAHLFDVDTGAEVDELAAHTDGDDDIPF